MSEFNDNLSNLHVDDKPAGYAAPIISLETLRSLLTYYPETGEFRWINGRGKMPENSVAGCLVRGVPHVRVKSVLIRSANLAHFWMTGLWRHVMTVNGDKTDIRWENLQVYTPMKPDVEDHSKWLYAYKKGEKWVVTSKNVPIDLVNKLQEVLTNKGI